MADPTQGNSVSFEDLEQQSQGTSAPADLTQIKLDGDNVPELLRGKTVAEAIAQFGSLEQALKTSEAARTQGQAPVAPTPEPEPEPELSEEQLAEMYQENPIQAIKVMQEQSQRRAEKNLEARLAPLVNGTASQVEQQARARYSDEFALFGDQIAQIAATIPNSKQILTNPAAWDDLIALVRGRPGNFDKLLEHKTRKTSEVTRQDAVRQQQETMGFSDNSGGRGRQPGAIQTLDPIQREIAEKMGLSEAEYIKWSKVS